MKPMTIARAVGNRKLIFMMTRRHNLAPTTHLNKAGEANPLPIVNECNPEAHSKPQRRAA